MDLIEDGTNSTNESISSTSSDDILVISIWSIILLYALITNTLTVIGISRSRSMRAASSYWIVISLSVCDLFMIIISLIHIIPATYLHETYVEILHPRTIWALFAYNVFWYTGVVQLAAMAVNRFVSIVYPLQYKRVFAPRNTLLIIGSLFLLGLLSSLPTLHECCYIVYNHHIYVTYYVPEDSGYMWLDILLNTVSVLTMILCYAAILIRVRKSTLTRRKHQMVALAARARRASAAALSATANSTSLSATANSAASKKTLVKTQRANCILSNGAIGNVPQGQRLWKQHLSTLAIPGSTSLSTLEPAENENDKKNKNDHKPSSDKKSPFSRSQGGSLVMSRIRSITKRDQRLRACEEGERDTVSRLLTPESRLRRQAAAANSKQNQRQHQQQQQASRREIRLFVQFFVVSLVFLSTWVTWQWLPRIPNASKWTYFATTTFFFINNAVNPTVYLIFNSGLRHQVKNLLCPQESRKGGAAKAAAAAAAALGGNQIATRDNNSSSDESKSNHNRSIRENRSLRLRQNSNEYSVGDEVSEEMRS